MDYFHRPFFMPTPQPLEYHRDQTPRPSPLLLASGMVVWIGCLALVAAAIEGAIYWQDGPPGAAVFFFVGPLVPAIVLGVCEYRVIAKQGRTAALFIGVIFSIPVLGIPRLLRGIAGLLGLVELDREYNSWIVVITIAALISTCGLIAITHYKWRNRLMSIEAEERSASEDKRTRSTAQDENDERNSCG